MYQNAFFDTTVPFFLERTTAQLATPILYEFCFLEINSTLIS